eukprot:TRINITY_DN30112_c0_g1_i1.p1 TRINITY_DN30112_c0_g1~~TRINITY_DN30112_c0_g1_i1.p1  ORF type:complete len:161 (+),score=35.30 TRINITY_DN30112_c0_g1_i1:94-576(+)
MDGQAALDFLITREEIDPKKIIVFGRSLGGAVAIDVAAKNQDKISGLILENTFMSIKEMIKAIFPRFSFVHFLCWNKWESITTIRNVTVPTFFLSSLQDEMVPPFHMKALFEACGSKNKTMQTFEKGKHMNLPTYTEYYRFFKEYIDSVFPDDKIIAPID